MNTKIIKGKIIEQSGNLTEDGVLKSEGSYDKLSGHIQERYGY